MNRTSERDRILKEHLFTFEAPLSWFVKMWDGIDCGGFTDGSGKTIIWDRQSHSHEIMLEVARAMVRQ